MNSFIGTKEAAKRLNVSVRRVQALIAAGRLQAKKIGNSFAIDEDDLKFLNGRKNGRPVHERTQEEWQQILDKILKKVEAEPNSASTKLQRKTIHISKKLLEKPPAERTSEEWSSILDQILGCVSLGPRDLSTNKKYMEGFGRENAYHR
jgi:excisionase family DNA binding protein